MIGQRDNMALVGILSTQLIVEQFIRNRPTAVSEESLEPVAHGAAIPLVEGSAPETIVDTTSPV